MFVVFKENIFNGTINKLPGVCEIMSALNLLNQPDTFGNYFQATPTPLPHNVPYHKKAVPNTLFGVGNDNSKQIVRRKQLHQPSRHRVNSSRKQLTKPIDSLSRNR